MKFDRRTFLLSVAASALMVGCASARFPRGASALVPAGWNELPIGGGGYLVGMSMSADGVAKIVRTDTHGAYRLSSSGIWQQLVTYNSMPSGYAFAGGVYEICVAPSASNIVYMMKSNASNAGYMFKSVDGGFTWSLLSNFSPVTVESNGTFRYAGRKMAVDPSNPDKVYVGTDSNGVWVTSNGGTSWSQISTSDIPISTTVGGQYPGHQICFLNSNTIYISSYGNQVRVSTNGGSSWTATSAGPTLSIHMVVGSNGHVWAVEYDASQALTNNLWRYNGSWSQQGVGMPMWAVAVDPADATHVVVQHYSGGLAWTNNGSATTPTWVKTNVPTVPVLTRSATDIPWLALSGVGAGIIQTADLQFDPVVSGKMWCPEGTGVWNVTAPTSINVTPVYTSITKGIEQLVSQAFECTPNGITYYICQDRNVFKANLLSYPSTYWNIAATGVNAGYSLDYAMNDPNVAVSIAFGQAGQAITKTLNGGSSWSAVSDPGTTVGGCVAVSTANNWVFAPSNNPQFIYYTKNGGSSWNTVGITTTQNPSDSNNWGWPFGLQVRSRIVDADRNTANKFYAYNFNPSGNGGGMYVSTDSGDTWTKIFNGPLLAATAFGAMRSIPGIPGQLLFTPQSDGQSSEFLRLTDDGLGNSNSLTKTTITSIAYVKRFGFGKNPPGQSYPTVYAATDNTSAAGPAGVYMSVDNCVSWTLLGAHPIDSTDVIVALDGDKIINGQCYVGFGGSGAAFYRP